MNNVIIKGILDEFCDEYVIDYAEDKAFETLVNYLVVNRIQNDAVETPEQILSIDVDEGGTFGIDGIAIFVNDNMIISEDDVSSSMSKSSDVNFVFTQSKISTNLDVGEISKFARSVQAFFKDEQPIDYSNAMSNKFTIKTKLFERNFAKNMSRSSPECTLYFAYAGKYTLDPTVEEVLRQEEQNIIREHPFLKKAKIIIIDSDKIVSMYNDSLNAIEIDIDFNRKLNLENLNNIEDVYYGFLNQKEFFKLIEDDEGNFRTNIFYDNVRDYLGDDNPVNKEITNTLQDSLMRQYFPVLNNGITIITRYIKPISSNRITIKDYQIVNGCQTSNVLFRCKSYLSDIDLSIPVKIIFTTDSNIISKIIRANNKQSQVPEEAFVALGEYHKQLQEYYKQRSKNVTLPIYYERRIREVTNDIELSLSKEQIITLHAQIRSMVSVYYNAPHLVYSNNPNFILKMKYDFFNTAHQKAPYYTSAYIVAKIRKLIKHRKIRNEYHFLVYYIALYFRVFCSGSYKPYPLEHIKNESEAKRIISILDNEKETIRIINEIIKLIDLAIVEVKKSDYKYKNMMYSQIAALTIFEDKMKEEYFKWQANNKS